MDDLDEFRDVEAKQSKSVFQPKALPGLDQLKLTETVTESTQKENKASAEGTCCYKKDAMRLITVALLSPARPHLRHGQITPRRPPPDQGRGH